VIGKPGRKRLIKRLRRRWEDNIKVEITFEKCVMWTGFSG
jgi:hypothetical protein